MHATRRIAISVCILMAALVIVVIALSIALDNRKTNSAVVLQQNTSDLNEVAIPTTTTEGPPRPWDNVRLTDSVLPLHYDLQLHPNLVSGTFTGHVMIKVHLKKATDYFVVHQHQLNVSNVDVRNEAKQSIDLLEHFYYPKNEFYVIRLKNEINSAQNYSLYFEFQGSLLKKIVGFYRSVYNDTIANKTRYLATSKFQPTYARQAFPCFDEPSFKSTFRIQLVHEDTYKALSNMDIENVNPYDNMKKLVVTTFRQSVPMVTYLACFIVCDFNYTETFTADGKPFRVYSRPDQIQYTRLALSSGSKIQDEYAKYFDIHYPLPKQDMIAIPDFPSGAMEHWGLITYRESRLLYDPTFNSPGDQQSIIKVIAHELTHQWFGNLVTMKWWDDLWLNEGFASFFAFKGLADAEPSWNTDAEIIRTLHNSFQLDNTDSSHPIVQIVEHPDEITEIFDAIAYSKGASVIQMLQGFMGADTFQKGIQIFLKKHQYSHATTNDLWNAMNQVTTDKSIEVANIMATWTLQMGFPVVTLQRNGKHFNVTQKRYLVGETAATGISVSPFNYLWEIPLSYISQGQRQPTIEWIHMKPEMQFETSVPDDQWIKFNANTTGYYRINYDKIEWQRLTKILIDNHQELHVTDRTGLLDDAFALADGGYVAYDVPLNMTFYLIHETDYMPWAIASSYIRSLGSHLIHTSGYSLFRVNYMTVKAIMRYH